MKHLLSPLLLISFLALFAAPIGAAAETNRPNIVLLMADDLGHADLGCYGNEEVETPNVDRLAEEGVRFTDFHSNAPVCSPTRAALLTGRYQQRAGVYAVYHGELKRSEVTIAQRLSAAGYATGIFGKWHVTGHARTPEEFAQYKDKVPTTWGFDEFTGIMSGMVDGKSHYTERGYHDWWHGNENVKEEGYATHLVTKHAVGFIREHAEEPFFCYVPYTDIHFPWMTPEDSPYYAEGVDNPAEAFPERKRGGQHSGTDRLQAVVHRMIREVDTSVGHIVAVLEELGIAEDTLVIFTSDNGGYASYAGHNQGEISDMGPYRGQKHQVYEGGIRVPMIAWQPGTIEPGRVSNETTLSFDFFPTFLEAAGLEAPPEDSPNALDGVSLLPLLKEGTPLPERRLFWNEAKKWAVRDGDWKLVIPGAKNAPELYDLAEDPGEAHDLADTQPEKVEELVQAMGVWAADVGTPSPPPGGEEKDDDAGDVGDTLSLAPLEEGIRLFADRAYRLSTVPQGLEGKMLLRTSIESGEMVCREGGELFALTPAAKDSAYSQESVLVDQGFERTEDPAFRLWTGQPSEVATFRKTVEAGERFRFRKLTVFVAGDGTKMEAAGAEPPRPWTENDGEKLYNGIVLPREWPPAYLKPASDEPMPVPYLDHPPEVIPIDVGRQLFVDDFLIEETDLERRFHHPEKFAGNPVFRAETETEVEGNGVVYLGQGGVFYDPSESHYKMFYTAGWRGPLALATSPDLVEWARPELGLYQENWLLPAGLRWEGKEITTAGSDNAVWFDAAANDPMNRIRYLTCWAHVLAEQRPDGFTHSLQTSDGKHWSPAVPTANAADYGSFFYNPFRKKWVQSIKQNGPRGRCRYYLETDEFLEGTDYDSAVYWTNADRLDQPEPADTYPGDPSPPQLYSLAGVAYESLMIGMHQIHRGPDNEVCAKGKFPKLTDLEVGFSRDGFHWDRPDREGFIRAERSEGAWDRGYVHTTTGVFVVHEDQLVFPYCAYSGVSSTEQRGMYHGASIGIATLRRDGFASMEATEKGGTLTTRPVMFSGRDLFLNFDAPDGEIRVEVLGEDGKLLATSKPLSGDSTRSQVIWEDREDLADFAGKPVRFRFRIEKGAIYAFWVSRDESGRSDGHLGAGGVGYPGCVDVIGSAVRP